MKLLTTILLMTIMVAANAQSYPKMISYKNVLQPGFILPLPYSPKTSEQTILTKLKETGYTPETTGALFWKKNKQEGFYVFPQVQLPQLNNQRLDLYFRINAVKDPVNRSAITLLVSKGNEIFVTPQADTNTYQAAQNFLNSFVEQTAAFHLNKELETQRQKIKEAEKKSQDLQGQTEDARKKIAELEAQIKKWEEEQSNQKNYLDTARVTLQNLETQQKADSTKQ